MYHRSLKKKFISGNQLSPKNKICPASDPGVTKHSPWSAVFYNSWLQPLRGPQSDGGHLRGADMYSCNMIFPSTNAERGHQRNQFMAPRFPRKLQLCSRKPRAKRVKTTCKIWPTVFIQPLSISLRAHQEKGKLLCILHFCEISCFCGEERNFLSFVYIKPANITGTGGRVPRGLSPRKL